MSLSLNQFLLLVITFVLVIAVTFFISLFLQLKKTAKEGEKTLVEIRTLVQMLKQTDYKVNTKIDDIGELVGTTKKTLVRIADLSWFLSAKIFKPSSKYWPFIYPAIRLGWRLIKKRKEKKNGK